VLSKKDVEMTIYQFDMVYRGLFMELLKFGRITDMVVCDNLYQPLRGSVFVVYDDIKSGEKCRKQMTGRVFDGKPVKPIVIGAENLDNLLCQASLKANCQRTASP
jgi:splicing factor U2AF subunit